MLHNCPPFRVKHNRKQWRRFVKEIFPVQGNEFGKTVSFEELNDIPFKIKRVYYMYDTAAGVVRGKHAHKTLNQVLVCTYGSCRILLDDGREKKVIPLEKPYEGLYVANDMWH